MNAALRANLPGLAGNADFWEDEALVNGIWSSILINLHPTTAAVGSYVVAPEMIKGTGTSSVIADLAVMQGVVAGGGALKFTKPSIVFEGKSALDTKSFNTIFTDQVKTWVTKANIGQSGKVWGIIAKGEQFCFVALDRLRSLDWYSVVMPPLAGGNPGFNNNPIDYECKRLDADGPDDQVYRAEPVPNHSLRLSG